MWTGGDISIRYERSRVLAQQQVDQDNAKAAITNSDVAASSSKNSTPCHGESQNTTFLHPLSNDTLKPSALAGKAELQAAESRQQVLEDKDNGGAEVLVDEAREEKEVRTMLKRTTRRRTTNSISGTDSLKGLRDRVTGSIHSRGGILGMESNR